MKSLLTAGCLALFLGVACSDGSRTSQEAPPFPGAGLLLISIDTLRADRLGCYGYDRGTSPNLDALAEESVLFTEMYSNSPKTASAHMSLFTSLLPTVHKVRNQSKRLGLSTPALAKNRLTIAQILNRNGYWNACIAGGGNIQPDMGFARGFRNRFESALWDIKRVVDRALDRLDQAQEAGQPPFVFMHTYQVHGPYLPPSEYEKRFAPSPSPLIGARVALYRDLPFNKQWSIMNRGPGNDETKAYWYGKENFDENEARYLSDLYDGEIAYTDAQLGRMIESLRESGQLDNLIVVIVADHGEEFLEHGDFEHDQLFSEHLHVPCIIRLPGGALGGTEVTGMASLIDIMPTLLELLDIEGPPTMAGTSLVSAMMTGHTDGKPVVSERVMFPGDYKASLRNENSSVIFHATEARLDAYNLIEDPGETISVFETADFSAPAAAKLKHSLGQAFHNRDALDKEDAGGSIVVDESRLEELQALGYVDGDASDFEIPEGTPLDHWPDG
ncbi:MAG: sulfatase [Planctomycetota bacterium]|jgi:arylsulfatase A-like enzyme|nr:sulfatase [Planctomycetota bacterium]